MLQTLLAERFQLKFHRETRELPAYLLVIAKGGPKLRRSGEADNVHYSLRIRSNELTGHKVPMQQFVGALSGQLNRPLLDRTGLQGDFDFSLHYTPDDGSMPDDGSAVDPNAPSSVSIFTAIQEQLGLKMERTKGPVSVLVIDHIEKPTEN